MLVFPLGALLKWVDLSGVVFLRSLQPLPFSLLLKDGGLSEIAFLIINSRSRDEIDGGLAEDVTTDKLLSGGRKSRYPFR